MCAPAGPSSTRKGARRPARIGSSARVEAAGTRELDHHAADTALPDDRGAIKSPRTRAHPRP
eukprot:7163756-Prymnesium_polylepis.1